MEIFISQENRTNQALELALKDVDAATITNVISAAIKYAAAKIKRQGARSLEKRYARKHSCVFWVYVNKVDGRFSVSAAPLAYSTSATSYPLQLSVGDLSDARVFGACQIFRYRLQRSVFNNYGFMRVN